jgi:hypothetical protein
MGVMKGLVTTKGDIGRNANEEEKLDVPPSEDWIIENVEDDQSVAGEPSINRVGDGTDTSKAGTTQGKRGISLSGIDPFVSSGTISKIPLVSGKNNDPTIVTDTDMIIAHLDNVPVFSWKNYPYNLNCQYSKEKGSMFYVKLPTIQERRGFIGSSSLKFAYSFLTYGVYRKGDHNIVKKQCMGVFVCSSPGCQFAASPKASQKKSRYSLPSPSKAVCPLHPLLVLQHISCFARLSVQTEHSDYLCVYIVDEHTNHQVPPQSFGNLPLTVKHSVQKKIVQNKKLGPAELITGTPQRPSLLSNSLQSPNPGVYRRQTFVGAGGVCSCPYFAPPSHLARTSFLPRGLFVLIGGRQM